MTDNNVTEIITEKAPLYKRAGTSVVEFVKRNKTALIVGGAAAAVILLQNRAIKSQTTFIDSKGLTDEYFGELTEGWTDEMKDDSLELVG